MKTKLILFLLFFIGITNVSYSQDTVSSKDAKNFIGETKIVRGIVSSIFVSNKGTVLINFDEPYPNATFVAVIKTGNTGVDYGDVKKGSILTITGKIEEYKGKPEIILYDQSQILLVE
ncbi:MAG: nucleotide-binding protein [Ignavibacteria bacterium]|nr:nucleotide-binding protein [Ignavibacteria bacterium]